MKKYSSYKDSGVKWLGEIPSHWKVLHLRNLIRIFSEKGFPNAQLLSVTREKGVILRNKDDKEENHNFVPDDLSGYKHLLPGDFIINKMKSWQGSYGVSPYEGIVSPAYYTCKLKGVDKDFFSKAIRSKAYIPFFSQFSKGIRVDQWDLDPSAMKNIPFVLPSIKEQRAIASYISQITEHIDQAMAQQKKMIDLLNERKQIIIQKAVTKGLNPNAEMKDSGIEWIGEIPSHWKVLHLRNFIRIFSEKGYPNSQLLSVTRDKGVIIRDKDDIEENHNFIPDDLRGYKHLMPGDFVINKMKSWQGSYGVSLYEGIVSPAYFTCKLKGVNKKFFSTAIRSKIYTAFFMQYSKGIRIGQWDLDPASMKNIPFILPPENEQIAITSYLEKPLHLISDEIGQKEKILSLLQERKQIIINDVVTGKVKVC